jgi:hypothetical protein
MELGKVAEFCAADIIIKAVNVFEAYSRYKILNNGAA